MMKLNLRNKIIHAMGGVSANDLAGIKNAALADVQKSLYGVLAISAVSVVGQVVCNKQHAKKANADAEIIMSELAEIKQRLDADEEQLDMMIALLEEHDKEVK